MGEGGMGGWREGGRAGGDGARESGIIGRLWLSYGWMEVVFGRLGLALSGIALGGIERLGRWEELLSVWGLSCRVQVERGRKG